MIGSQGLLGARYGFHFAEKLCPAWSRYRGVAGAGFWGAAFAGACVAVPSAGP